MVMYLVEHKYRSERFVHLPNMILMVETILFIANCERNFNNQNRNSFGQ